MKRWQKGLKVNFSLSFKVSCYFCVLLEMYCCQNAWLQYNPDLLQGRFPGLSPLYIEEPFVQKDTANINLYSPQSPTLLHRHYGYNKRDSKNMQSIFKYFFSQARDIDAQVYIRKLPWSLAVLEFLSLPKENKADRQPSFQCAWKKIVRQDTLTGASLKKKFLKDLQVVGFYSVWRLRKLSICFAKFASLFWECEHNQSRNFSQVQIPYAFLLLPYHSHLSLSYAWYLVWMLAMIL